MSQVCRYSHIAIMRMATTLRITMGSQAIILALRRQRQEDCYKFKANLSYTVSSLSSWAKRENLSQKYCSKNKRMTIGSSRDQIFLISFLHFLKQAQHSFTWENNAKVVYNERDIPSYPHSVPKFCILKATVTIFHVLKISYVSRIGIYKHLYLFTPCIFKKLNSVSWRFFKLQIMNLTLLSTGYAAQHLNGCASVCATIPI